MDGKAALLVKGKRLERNLTFGEVVDMQFIDQAMKELGPFKR